MIGLFADLIARVSNEVPDFKSVGGPYLLSALPRDEFGTLLPAAIVMPGAGTHQNANTLTGPRFETQDWQVVVVVSYNNDDATFTQSEMIAADLMTKVHKAVHDWAVDRSKARRQFVYKGRDAPNYQLGYIEFALNFTIDAVIK